MNRVKDCPEQLQYAQVEDLDAVRLVKMGMQVFDLRFFTHYISDGTILLAGANTGFAPTDSRYVSVPVD